MAYRGSRYNNEAHGFGRYETEEYVHMGWFENNKPFGFGLRLYSEGGKDVGLWEQDVLVQMAIIYNNGMQHRMELLFGHNVNAFKDRVTNLTGVLTIPKLRLNSLNIPSTGSLLVLTETALKEMKEIQRSFEHDLGRYRSVQVDVPIEKAALAHLQSEFDTDQETVIDRLIQDESNQIIKMFWTKVTKSNSINQPQVDLDDAMDYLNGACPDGPKTCRILETFEAIENYQYNDVLKYLREGVDVGSRDLLGYTLLHCSIIFNSTRVVNALINAGSVGVTCLHFTPLNLALMLHFLPRLMSKIQLCRGESAATDKSAAAYFDLNRSEMDSAYGSSVYTISSTEEPNSKNSRPHSAMTATSSKPGKVSRPHSAMPAVTMARNKSPAGNYNFSRSHHSSRSHQLQNYVRVIKKMINIGIVNVAPNCPFILPELFWPILGQDDKMVVEMLLAGANAKSTVDVGGMRIEAIHLASETTAKVVSALIAARGNPNLNVQHLPDNKPNTKFVFNIDDISEGSNSSALFRCAKRGRLAQAISLIKGGAKINEFDNGFTPLGVAILNGHFDLVWELLKYGADPSQAQEGGGTPIALILHPKTDPLYTLREKIALVDLLVDHGAKLYEKCSLVKQAKRDCNTIDYTDHKFHPARGPPPISGFFSSLRIDEQRNYLARSEIQSYLTSIIREQLSEKATEKDPIAQSACFECGKAKKKLTVDSHFKVIAFCSVKCRKQFWRSNPSRSEIKPKKRKVFNFDPFFLQRDLVDNYSYN